MSESVNRAGAPSPASRRSMFHFAAGGALAASLPGCAAPDRGPAVPLKRTWEASVLGLPNERFFPAAGAGPLEQEFAQAFMRQAALKGVKSPFDLLDCGVGIEKQTRRVSDNRVEAADRVAEGKKDRYRSGTGTSTLAG